MTKEKIELEYIVNSSPSVMFPQLSTPSGLSEWFADNVNIKSDSFIFMWEGSEQIAKVLSKRQNVFVRFKWEEDEDEESYFEFRLTIDDITGEVALVVTDFAEPDEKEDTVELWDAQIDKLRHIMGL